MHIADAQQGSHIGLVRLGGERVAEEDDGLNLAKGDAAADDQIAAIRTVRDAFDFQARFLADQSPRAAGGDERVSLQDVAVADGELH